MAPTCSSGTSQDSQLRHLPLNKRQNRQPRLKTAFLDLDDVHVQIVSNVVGKILQFYIYIYIKIYIYVYIYRNGELKKTRHETGSISGSNLNIPIHEVRKGGIKKIAMVRKNYF